MWVSELRGSNRSAAERTHAETSSNAALPARPNLVASSLPSSAHPSDLRGLCSSTCSYNRSRLSRRLIFARKLAVEARYPDCQRGKNSTEYRKSISNSLVDWHRTYSIALGATIYSLPCTDRRHYGRNADYSLLPRWRADIDTEFRDHEIDSVRISTSSMFHSLYQLKLSTNSSMSRL